MSREIQYVITAQYYIYALDMILQVVVKLHSGKWEQRNNEMKKISSLMRHRMLLDLEEKGMSAKELKEKHGIADNRTLRKHLGLAEREREAKEARIKILADNQAQHLAEIRTTIEQWNNTLKTPWFGKISFETGSRPAGDFEHNPPI